MKPIKYWLVADKFCKKHYCNNLSLVFTPNKDGNLTKAIILSSVTFDFFIYKSLSFGCLVNSGDGEDDILVKTIVAEMFWHQMEPQMKANFRLKLNFRYKTIYFFHHGGSC